jgi:hypothetical protein
MPQGFVIIRPMYDGSITVRPFVSNPSFRSDGTALGTIKTTCKIRWWKRQLPHGRKHPEWWHKYISQVSKRQYDLLTRHG